MVVDITEVEKGGFGDGFDVGLEGESGVQDDPRFLTLEDDQMEQPSMDITRSPTFLGDQLYTV